MSPILECIPNFSEGKDLEVLGKIAEAIQTVPQVKLLHKDSGESANRSVFTFAGNPDSVVAAAFEAIKIASETIDMRQHKGVHPRMGATDVCPLVPIEGISMQEAIVLSHRLGKRVGEELGIPVYMYERSAVHPHKKNLAHIRKGEYEGFAQKIQDPHWKPDYGPKFFQPIPGQTVIGARDFLIAYNINLNTKDVSIAKSIAAQIRESGQKLKKGEQVVRIPGMCKHVKAIGWEIPEFGCTQVSTNLVNIHETPPHVVYEATREVAQSMGVQVTGSELIGCIPLFALLEAGRYYASLKSKEDLSEASTVALAVEKLGLNQLSFFHPSERILEYML